MHHLTTARIINTGLSIFVCNYQGEPMRYIFGAVMYLSGLYACFMAYESHETAKQLDLLGAASGGVFFLMNCSTIIDVVSW